MKSRKCKQEKLFLHSHLSQSFQPFPKPGWPIRNYHSLRCYVIEIKGFFPAVDKLLHSFIHSFHSALFDSFTISKKQKILNELAATTLIKFFQKICHLYCNDVCFQNYISFIYIKKRYVEEIVTSPLPQNPFNISILWENVHIKEIDTGVLHDQVTLWPMPSLSERYLYNFRSIEILIRYFLTCAMFKEVNRKKQYFVKKTLRHYG